MSLQARLEEDLRTALKNKRGTRVGVLRFLLAGIHNRLIEKRGAALLDADILDVLKKEAKKRREAIDLFTKGNRIDLAEREKNELAIISEYLPPELSRAAIDQVINEVVKRGETDFGVLMREAMKRLKGQADGNLVGQLIKEKLGK